MGFGAWDLGFLAAFAAGLRRVTSIVHTLNGTTRWFSYAYDSVGNRKWTTREGNVGDVFSYDLAHQVSGVQLNVANPSGVQSIPRSIIYDANGNRGSFTPYGSNDLYVTNDLNQYTQRNRTNAGYDYNGNLTAGLDQPTQSSYTYDAQNRLTSAHKGGTTETFTYDGLNRQVSRTVGGVTTYSAWDGWNLMQEYRNGNITATYVHEAGGLVKEMLTNNYYYQDGSGSTSHLANSGGALLEWYRYDLHGTPIVYNSGDYQISGSGFDLHLFTGQQWYSEVGLYDLRNRFYSPDIGRFLQPDPIGFKGDATNLYRYCGNNPVTLADPSGLEAPWPGWPGAYDGGPMFRACCPNRFFAKENSTQV